LRAGNTRARALPSPPLPLPGRPCRETSRPGGALGSRHRPPWLRGSRSRSSVVDVRTLRWIAARAGTGGRKLRAFAGYLDVERDGQFRRWIAGAIVARLVLQEPVHAEASGR